MQRFLLILFFIPQVTLAQREIQHEPERIFNKLFNGPAATQFMKEKNLKKVTFYRDAVLSSSMEFDRSGNLIAATGMENNVVRKSTYKWDEQNRIIEKKYYSTDSSFRYGYYYRYEKGAQLMYKIEDSLLFRKETFLKGENISTYSEYDSEGIVILKNVYVKDKDMKWLLETRFQDDKIHVQYRYEYIDNKKFVTAVNFDKNGTKINEKRYLDEIKIDNRVLHYTRDYERLFRVDSFDQNNNLVEMELLDKDGNATRKESSEYNSKGQLVGLIKEDIIRDQRTIYTYKYDESGRVELVKKSFNGETEIFRYLYETF